MVMELLSSAATRARWCRAISLNREVGVRRVTEISSNDILDALVRLRRRWAPAAGTVWEDKEESLDASF